VAAAENDNVQLRSTGSANQSSNTLRSPVDLVGQRSSLPDIPLTPKERAYLEHSNKSDKQVVRPSFSTENILSENEPPPKPPKPNSRLSAGPPLPPKKKPLIYNHCFNDSAMLSLDCSDIQQNPFLLCSGMNDQLQLSSRSRSPEDNSDLISTGSIDSILNQSREDDFFHESNAKETERESQKILNTDSTIATSFDNRNSNESGFISINSHHSSGFSMIQHQQQANFISKTVKSIQTASSSISGEVQEVENNLSSMSLKQHHHHQIGSLSGEEINRIIDECTSPPPLPIKTRTRSMRSERHKSTYDNVDEIDRKSSEINVSTASSSTSSLTSGSTLTSSSMTFHNKFDHHEQNAIIKNKYISCIEPRDIGRFVNDDHSDEQPPPLPMKKKHSE